MRDFEHRILSEAKSRTAGSNTNPDNNRENPEV